MRTIVPMKGEKKILVLTDAFMPPAYVPRVRTLCDVLLQNGWKVKVMTEKVKGVELDFPHDYMIEYVDYYKHQALWGKVEWIWKFFLGLLYDHKGCFFTKRFNELLKDESFDLVLCSSYHTFPLTVAAKLAAKRQIPLHVDLRDIAEQCAGHQYNQHKWGRNSKLLGWMYDIYQQITIKRRNQVLQKANSLSSVSPWHVELLRGFNPNVYLIYNGYDQRMFQPKNMKSETFKIIYTGMIYGKQMQDPTLFFDALHSMHEKGIMPQQLECHFYVKPITQQILNMYAEERGLTEYMYCHDYVKPKEVPHLLQEASIVLVLSNKTGPNGPHGVMTTKFYEALGVEKPVLCVRSDEDCLAQVIQETEAGIAVTNIEEVEQFIMEKYKEWCMCGYTHQRVNMKEKEKYCRQKQAVQFLECITNLVKV